MKNLARLSVHDTARSSDAPTATKNMCDALMTKAHTENGKLIR